MQLRYYWDDALEDCIVRQTNAKFIYAYEYLGAYGISSLLACQNDQILQTIGLWIWALKTFVVLLKLVPKKKGELLPNGEVNGLLQSWNQLLPHGKRMYINCRQHFPCFETKFFPWHILCLVCAKSEVHQVCDKLSNFLLCPNQCFFFPPNFMMLPQWWSSTRRFSHIWL